MTLSCMPQLLYFRFAYDFIFDCVTIVTGVREKWYLNPQIPIIFTQNSRPVIKTQCLHDDVIKGKWFSALRHWPFVWGIHRSPFFHGNTFRVHDDVIKCKHFPRYWSFVRGIHRSPVNSPNKGHWHGALMFSLICAWINGWVDHHKSGDLRRHRVHYDVTIMDMRATGPPCDIVNLPSYDCYSPFLVAVGPSVRYDIWPPIRWHHPFWNRLV